MKKKRWYGKDRGLTLRMMLTAGLLMVVYLAFLTLLSFYLEFWFLLMLAAIFVFLQFYFADKLVLWSTGAKIVSPQESPQLHTIVERLCSMAALPKPRIAVINTPMPNAFATGRSQKNAVVAVTTGLLQKLDSSEVEAVLGHELSHVKNRDVLVITIASFLSTIAWFVMRFSFYSSLFRGGGRDRNAGATIIIFAVSLLVWLISFLLIRALSRYREFAADRGSAIITHNPSALISALSKISGAMKRVPTRDLREVEGINAFFIIPALSGGSIMNLFSTHPPIEKRIERLKEMTKGLEGFR